MTEYIPERVVARQIRSVQMRGVTLVDRDAVKDCAKRHNYDELVTWVEEVESDHYLCKVEEFVQKGRCSV